MASITKDTVLRVLPGRPPLCSARPLLCCCCACRCCLPQITFQPYACRMLDTLRRLAVYGLMSTLFMLMLVTLSERESHDQLLAACMVIVAFINVGVIGVHLWACASEVRRWLLWSAGKGPGDTLTWADVKAVVLPEGFWDPSRQQPWWAGGCFKPRGAWRQGQPRGVAAGGQREGGGAGGGRPGLPAEQAPGSPSFSHQATGGGSGLTGGGSGPAVGPAEQGPGREGVVVVINPSPPEPAPTPTPGWLGRELPS